MAENSESYEEKLLFGCIAEWQRGTLLSIEIRDKAEAAATEGIETTKRYGLCKLHFIANKKVVHYVK